MGFSIWDKLKELWICKTNEYILQHQKICPGRIMEATSVLKVIRYNWFVRNQEVFLNVPHSHKFRKQEFPPIQGFLLQSCPGNGRSFFVHTMCSTYPSTLCLLQHVKPFSKFRNSYLHVDNFLEITVNFQYLFQEFHTTLCTPFASTCFQYSNQKLSHQHLPLSEQLYLIHETFVQGLRQNSQLESVLQLIILAANNLHKLYLSTWHQLEQQNCKSLCHTLDHLITCESKDAELVYNFLVMGGNLLWVSIKGFSDIRLETIQCHKKLKNNKYSHSYKTIVMKMICELLNRTKTLPVLFFFWAEKNVLEQKVFHHFTLQTLLDDPNEKCNTNSAYDVSVYWSYVHERLIPVDFSNTISLDIRRTIVVWFFEESFQKYSLSYPETVITSILECTSSTTIPQLIHFLQALIYQATLKTSINNIKGMKTYITEEDILQCAQKHFVVPVHETHFLDFRAKKSFYSSSTQPCQWITIAYEKDKKKQETLDELLNGFITCKQKGWPYSFCFVEGESGSGKSYLATCLAQNCNVGLLCIYPSDVMKPLLGDSEKSILTIFKVAYENSPCIVCFEDADTWCENNEANEFSQPSSVTVRLTTELLRQLDELRFNYVFKNIPCPVLVLLLTNTTENHEKKFHSNFYQPHRQGKRILLPLLKYWKTEDFVTIFFNQFNEPLINCESNEKDQNTCFSVVCEIFTNNIHHLKSPAAVKKLINTIHQLKLRRFTKLNATFCKNRMENNTAWSQHSICMCDIIDAFKKIT